MRIIPFEVTVERGYWLGEYADSFKPTFVINVLGFETNDHYASLLELGWIEGKFTWELLYMSTLLPYIVNAIYEWKLKRFPIDEPRPVYDSSTFEGISHLMTTGHEYAVQWRDNNDILLYYKVWIDRGPAWSTLPEHAARLSLKEAQDISSRLAKAGFHMPFISTWTDEPKCDCGRALVFGKCSNINCNWGKE